MNKKYIAILLILGFILTGFSSINAADNISIADDADTVSEDTLTSDSVYEEESIEEETTEEEIEEETTEEETTEEEYEIYEDVLKDEAPALLEASDDDINDLIDILSEYDSEDVNKLIDLLKNRKDYDEKSLAESLSNLDPETLLLFDSATAALSISDMNDDEFNQLIDELENSKYAEVYDKIIDMLSSGEYDVADLTDLIREVHDNDEAYNELADIVNSILIPNTTSTNTNITANQNTASPKNTQAPVKNNPKMASNTKTDIISQAFAPFKQFTKKTPHVTTAYQIYQKLLKKYLAGEITFDDLKAQLEEAGIDTTDLKLNDDMSITFMGQTSDVPEKLAQEEDTTAQNETETNETANDTQEENTTDSETTQNTDNTQSGNDDEETNNVE